MTINSGFSTGSLQEVPKYIPLYSRNNNINFVKQSYSFKATYMACTSGSILVKWEECAMVGVVDTGAHIYNLSDRNAPAYITTSAYKYTTPSNTKG